MRLKVIALATAEDDIPGCCPASNRLPHVHSFSFFPIRDRIFPNGFRFVLVVVVDPPAASISNLPPGDVMKFKSAVLTQVSGSLGGATYAHNQGGMYIRARSIPTNPQSAAQTTVRNNFSSLAARWSTTLTAANRTAWDNYAFLSPVTDKFGDPLKLSGFQMFIRANSLRLLGGKAVVDQGPAQPGLTDFGTTSLAVSDSPPDINVTFDTDDQWVDSDDGVLLCQTSRFVSPTINFYKGPFRFLGALSGNATTAPTSPHDFGDTNAFGEELGNGEFVGQKLFVRLIASDGTGRPSPVFTHSTLVVA